MLATTGRDIRQWFQWLKQFRFMFLAMYQLTHHDTDNLLHQRSWIENPHEDILVINKGLNFVNQQLHLLFFLLLVFFLIFLLFLVVSFSFSFCCGFFFLVFLVSLLYNTFRWFSHVSWSYWVNFWRFWNLPEESFPLSLFSFFFDTNFFARKKRRFVLSSQM